LNWEQEVSKVGLTSLILNRVKPNSLIVTDFAEPILDTLSHNFSINGIENIRLDEKEKNQNLYDKPVVKISKLDWRKETEESLLPFENMDVILAADVVYDPSLAVDMIRIVKLLLNLKRENNKKRVAYLANTARNPTTFQSYLEALKNANLEYEDHSKFKFDKIFQYSRDNITLFKIYEK